MLGFFRRLLYGNNIADEESKSSKSHGQGSSING